MGGKSSLGDIKRPLIRENIRFISSSERDEEKGQEKSGGKRGFWIKIVRALS